MPRTYSKRIPRSSGPQAGRLYFAEKSGGTGDQR